MLPLLLGLAGMFFQFRKDYHWGIVVLLLFLMTGLAIVTYLNQQPYEPRKRDYSYSVSFFAFSIWCGLGALWLIDFLSGRLKMKEMFSTLTSRSGENEKANGLAESLTGIICQNIDYYRPFSPDDQKNFNNDLEMDLGNLERMQSLASKYHQEKLAAKLDSIFKSKESGMVGK